MEIRLGPATLSGFYLHQRKPHITTLDKIEAWVDKEGKKKDKFVSSDRIITTISTKSLRKKQIAVTPGSLWGNKQLEYFRIEINEVKDFEIFFQESPPKIESLPEEIKEALSIDLSKLDILYNIDWGKIRHKQVSRVVKSLLAVTKTHRILFNYDEGDLRIQCREEMKLEMCGSTTSAKPDVCIETSHLMIKLLIKEDKNYQVFNINTVAEPQIIGEAIGAFQENSKFGQPLESQLLPCITMLGTCSTLYLIGVTKELAECVRIGDHPKKKTIVKRYAISAQIIPMGDAMLLQNNRHHIFQYYEAFRKFVVRKHVEIYFFKQVI
ncbi:7142_t:CDS:2 [Entrophospora sp. SA101]|nr:7142_t:CDS:2 [Entrophospora sp. SA101]